MKNTITELEKQKIDEFEVSLNKDPNWSFSNISGGFVNVEIAEHNEKSIFLTVKSGVKSDCENRVYEDYFELVRDTLAIYETN